MIIRDNYTDQWSISPQGKGVKKIKAFSVKKTVLSELCELTVFRKRHWFLGFFL
jgi:hypothetical protein